jgi:hypothetical protein
MNEKEKEKEKKKQRKIAKDFFKKTESKEKKA